MSPSATAATAAAASATVFPARSVALPPSASIASPLRSAFSSRSSPVYFVVSLSNDRWSKSRVFISSKKGTAICTFKGAA